jgi:hypothetical protein
MPSDDYNTSQGIIFAAVCFNFKVFYHFFKIVLLFYEIYGIIVLGVKAATIINIINTHTRSKLYD